jgi:hypothetical protein
MRCVAAIAILAFAIPASAEPIANDRGAWTDQYYFVRKEFDRPNPNIVRHEYRNRARFKLAANKYHAPVHQGSIVTAFAVVDLDPNHPDAPCHIHYMRIGNSAKRQASYDHEVLHCKYGRWHD